MKEKRFYINGLDGIRAFAIIGITLFHIFPQEVKGGYLGVSLFFVLTGFLLAVTSKRKFSLFDYIKKRIVRIYPALLIVIFTTIALLFFISPNSISGMKQEVLSIVLGYNNWWQIGQNADYFSRVSNASPFTHFWYLGIELQYYLIWPILYLIYRMGKKAGNNWISITILSVLTFMSIILMPMLYKDGMDVTTLYYGTHTRVYALLLGSILGFLWSEKKKEVSTLLQIVCTILTILLFAISCVSFVILDGQSSLLYRGGMIVMTIIFMAMIWLVSSPSLWIGKILDWKPFKWIGSHSYSIFLWQYPVIFVFSKLKLNEFYFKFIEILVIVLLAVLVDYIVNVKKARSKIVWAITALCTAICMGFGAYGLYMSDDSLEEAQEELREDLEENAKLIEEKQKELEEKKEYSTTQLVMVGDSVLLSVAPVLYEMYPDCYINAEVGRHCGEEVPILENLVQYNALGDTVIISMGTNGTLNDGYIQVTLAVIGADREIFWINNYCPDTPWETGNNEYINYLAENHDNVHVIDWYSVASQHPEYLSMDYVHPNDDGILVYANLIKSALEGE